MPVRIEEFTAVATSYTGAPITAVAGTRNLYVCVRDDVATAFTVKTTWASGTYEKGVAAGGEYVLRQDEQTVVGESFTYDVKAASGSGHSFDCREEG